MALRRFWSHLVTLWRWLPVVWRDEPWDYVYLVRVIRHKLALMEACFESQRTSRTDAAQVAAQIRRARVTADKLLADEYLALALLPRRARWGEMVFDWSTGTHFSKATTPEEQAQARDSWRAACNAAEAAQQADWELLWNSLRDNAQNWWD